MKIYLNTLSNSFAIYTNFEPKDKTNLIEVNENTYNEYVDKTSNFYNAEIKVVDSVVDISYTLDTEAQENSKLGELRAKREPLLKAFDVYKTNVFYGIENETNEEHSEIVAWYNAILDLDEEAIDNVPTRIAKYL